MNGSDGMDEMTTHTRRENARRAGVAAGVPADRINELPPEIRTLT
ncbi:hypothetical protein ACSSV4_000995 [Roseovarius sp. MBR-154]